MKVSVITARDIKQLIDGLESHNEYHDGGAMEAAQAWAVERACGVLANLLDDMLTSAEKE